MSLNLPRLIGRCLLGWALVLACSAVLAQARVVLDDSASAVNAWPAVTALADPAGAWTLSDARQRAAAFAVPKGPEANFGVHRNALWLRLPLQVRGSDGRWTMQIDYAPLNRVDVYLLSQGKLVQQATLGNAQPFDARPVHSRAHALLLDLPAGEHEIYLRVMTQSSMLVPISFLRRDAFLVQESSRQLLQGLAAGIALGLLAYSLAHWMSLRERLFGQYAAMLLGVAVFFLSYFGIGQQYLWPVPGGLIDKIAPLAVLLAVAAGSQFVSGALQIQRHSRWSHYGLQGVSLAAAAMLLASALGLLDYRQTQGLATVLGPLPMLVAIPVAYRLARAGDRVALLMLLGWTAYSLGVLTLAALLRGLLPVNFWTQHAFQLASLLEMAAWVRVLGVRIADVRLEAERVQLERQTLLTLAHTDALTGLPNRRGLQQAMSAALALIRADSVLAVFLLDLDGFKAINDRLGHDAGDELLVQVGQRLRQQLRNSDQVARLGGDEFVVIAAGLLGEADAQRLGAKLLGAFDLPFTLAGQSCRIGLTIGFALAPHDGRDGGDLLKRADAAMYVGKQAGRHCVRRGGASLAFTGF
jgi:diguanylate cyclase (GGDEF)-like protein